MSNIRTQSTKSGIDGYSGLSYTVHYSAPTSSTISTTTRLACNQCPKRNRWSIPCEQVRQYNERVQARRKVCGCSSPGLSTCSSLEDALKKCFRRYSVRWLMHAQSSGFRPRCNSRLAGKHFFARLWIMSTTRIALEERGLLEERRAG